MQIFELCNIADRNLTTLEVLQEEMLLKETENGPPILEVIHHIEINFGLYEGRNFVAAIIDMSAWWR